MTTELAPATTMLSFTETPCWDVDQLAQQVKLHWSRIQEHATAVTFDYWRLGGVLESARGNFARGKWGPWLASCGVTPYRASQARALARAFHSPDDFHDQSLEHALAAARLKLGRTTASAADRKLRQQLHRIRKALGAALPKVQMSAARPALSELLGSIVADARALHRAAVKRK